jgi:4,5-dihydroxyphthalate decarboxylase
VKRLELTLAIGEYDHVRDLTSGAVRPDGIDLIALSAPVEEMFFRFARFREWDVSEMSLAKYASLVSAGDTAFTAIPVFPSRVFRHSSIYVRSAAGIAGPADLAGHRVGVPQWEQTAVVYARGMLMHDHGLSLHDVEWFQCGTNEPRRDEQTHPKLPRGISYAPVSGRSLNQMLLAGDLDAAITAAAPKSFVHGDPAVVRLFPDFESVERDYYARTGIFPIMHIVGLRREVLDEYPWVAMNLMKAFEQAKRASLERISDVSASRVAIPWGFARVTEALELMGKLWPYGIEPNRPTLDAFLGYCEEQFVTPRRLKPEELVPAEVAGVESWV